MSIVLMAAFNISLDLMNMEKHVDVICNNWHLIAIKLQSASDFILSGTRNRSIDNVSRRSISSGRCQDSK